MTEMIRIKRDDKWKGEDSVLHDIQEVRMGGAGDATPGVLPQRRLDESSHIEDDGMVRQAAHLMGRRGSMQSTSRRARGPHGDRFHNLPPRRGGARHTPPIFDGVPRAQEG